MLSECFLSCRKNSEVFFERCMTIIFKILVPSGFWILLVVMWLLSPHFLPLYMPPDKRQISLCLSVTNVCFFMKLFLQGQGEKPSFFTVRHVTLPFFPFSFLSLLPLLRFILQKGGPWHCRAVVGWGRGIGKWVREKALRDLTRRIYLNLDI